MTELLRVTVADGKYTVIQEEGGGLRALRHGEEWPAQDIAGSGFVLALAQEIHALRSRVMLATQLLEGQKGAVTMSLLAILNNKTELTQHALDLGAAEELRQALERKDEDLSTCEQENSNLRAILAWVITYLEGTSIVPMDVLRKMCSKPLDEGGLVRDMLCDAEDEIVAMGKLMQKVVAQVEKLMETDAIPNGWHIRAEALLEQMRGYDPEKQAPTYGLSKVIDK